MYFWKIKNLKQEIIENKVTSRDNILYLILFFTLYMVLFVQAIFQIHSLWNIEMVLLQVLISFLGIGYAYYKSVKSGVGEAKVFIEHFTAVGWVFLLRSLFFMTIGMLNLYVMTHIFSFEALFTAKNAVIVGMSFELLLYWRIGKHIESLNVIKFTN